MHTRIGHKTKSVFTVRTMPYVVRRPEGLPPGPVVYVPNVGDNRLDLEDPFRCEIHPISYEEIGGLVAMTPPDLSDDAVLEVDGKKQLSEQGQVATGNHLFELHILKSVKAVWSGSFEEAKTGTMLSPTDGESLLHALKRTFPREAMDVMTDLGRACTNMHHLQQGDYDFLKSSQP